MRHSSGLIAETFFILQHIRKSMPTGTDNAIHKDDASEITINSSQIIT
jgi:hypothetical protein